jgi:superfamily II DNA or RNA helicase
MTSEFEVGDRVSFYGGQGDVIDIVRDGASQKLEILTEAGEVQEISPSLPMVRKLDAATEDDLVDFLGGRARVISRQERANDADLLYLRTEDGELKKIPADCEGLEPGKSITDRLRMGEFDDPVRFSLRERAARLSLAYRSDRFLSLSGNRIRIEPYQVDAAHEVLSAYEPRYLIGDEVGLGKTIEAGIIIEELIARGRAERVLIVTPAGLRDQWQREMREKFGREYVAYDRDYIDSIDRSGENVWNAEDRIVVSIDLAKQDDLLEQLRRLEEAWDVVIIDEAHHLTARETSDGTERVDRYRVGEAVADNSDALLFLTGTPHKGKPDQFYNLMKLLDPYRFQSPDDITSEKVDDLMIRRMKTDDSMVDGDGEPMFPDREITTVPVELTAEERELYEDLTEYISAVYTASAETDRHAAGFTMVIYQKRLVSSIAAITQSLRNRREDLEEKTPISGDVAGRFNCVNASAETKADVLDQLIRAGETIEIDSKGNRLREFIDGVLVENPDEKILVFTEYTDTLEYLRDEVLADRQVATIQGGMDQNDRWSEIQKFEDDASVLLATDAAREGINLQFAHIMLNYDLPWNPIRIDQRMGRLHRYGQDETVRIYNLFIEDTRESDILQLLVGKLDQIEEDLGMRSDVLGTVLDDYDVEGAIMDAVTGQRESDAVKADLDQAIEERKAAVEKIENEFLIQDKFDAEDHRAVQNLIDLSKERPVREDDIEQLVREFCREFGGRVKSSVPGQAPEDHHLHTVEVPDILSMNSEVGRHYARVTFSRETALEKPTAKLVSLNHELVQQIIQYCLDGDWIDGQAAALVTREADLAPGVLATYRLGYVSGDGELPTEDYLRTYVDTHGILHEEPPEILGALPPELATPHPGARDTAAAVDEALETAAGQASKEVQDLVEDVRTEREQKVEIKEDHARRYFTQKIRELEDRLTEYRRDQRDTDKDMQVALDTTRKELEDLEEDWEAEQARLERERTIIPDDPELVNAAVVTSQVPAVELSHRTTWSRSELADAISGGDDATITYLPLHDECEDIDALDSSRPRLLRPAQWEGSIELEQIDAGEQSLWRDSDYSGDLPDEVELERFDDQLHSDLTDITDDLDIRICITDQPLEGLVRDGALFCNCLIGNGIDPAFWQIVSAREAVYANPEIPAERRIPEIVAVLAG